MLRKCSHCFHRLVKHHESELFFFLNPQINSPPFPFPSLHFFLSQNVHKSLYIYIYMRSLSFHTYTLTRLLVEFKIFYAMHRRRFYYITTPTLMDSFVFFHAPYIHTSLLFLFAYSLVPLGRLSWGLEE